MARVSSCRRKRAKPPALDTEVMRGYYHARGEGRGAADALASARRQAEDSATRDIVKAMPPLDGPCVAWQHGDWLVTVRFETDDDADWSWLGTEIRTGDTSKPDPRAIPIEATPARRYKRTWFIPCEGFLTPWTYWHERGMSKGEAKSLERACALENARHWSLREAMRVSATVALKTLPEVVLGTDSLCGVDVTPLDGRGPGEGFREIVAQVVSEAIRQAGDNIDSIKGDK